MTFIGGVYQFFGRSVGPLKPLHTYIYKIFHYISNSHPLIEKNSSHVKINGSLNSPSYIYSDASKETLVTSQNIF